MHPSAVSGIDLDRRMYEIAAQKTGNASDPDAFARGYAEGRFHFADDAALVAELIMLHGLNVHVIAGEWLVFTSGKPVFGARLGEAVCRWVIQFG